MQYFAVVTLNGLTLAALYFLAASGFTLIFGLMRTVNMAHGGLLLLGAYLGYEITTASGSWVIGLVGSAIGTAAVGALIQACLLGRYQGEELRQTLLTIALSIILADLMLAYWGGITYQIEMPALLSGSVFLPVLNIGYAAVRIFVMVLAIGIGVGLWLLISRTKLGMMIRAGVDDRDMLRALGFNVGRIFIYVFALGGALAGVAGNVAASALSVAPGTDVQYLLFSLVVVIVGGMGSVGGAALGALMVGLAEQYGLAYAPTYSVVFTFGLMVLVLAFRPQGLIGKAEV
ncbi:branched-chain amino acid ABC transporter permease [Candidatus Puniceispirillum marinum]|uniref:ABC transporter ATP-binding protein n=1 Tax=Puniceispirillum marinum (strain IMCC1322) TaxID=488538 RepID=D5BMI8_PUNMI|nr:branched-chain amino acid ABC transporter permease [Candidatus Puniceispirillum marinum]ADE40031.1 ABC transporter ATP-binding protein [Candidatus Puniceispirillum marinum IMCC1322]